MENYNSLSQIQKEISSHKTTCKNLVEGYLNNISENKSINAFIETYDAEALRLAECVDVKIKNGKAGKLAGLVLGIKDNICYKGHSSSAASKILEGFKSTYSATVVERLIKEDAIIIGRLNCDEFAMGSSSENTPYGPVRNPLNTKYVAGGSSGGSAAAVKANFCQAALGTDTGGSIRQPSAFCGVMGLKPTYGLVSRHGLIAYASSFDQIGPITKSAEDLAHIMHVISGKDDFDSTCFGEKSIQKIPEIKKYHKFAVIKQTIAFKNLNSEIQNNFNAFLKNIQSKGHKVEYIDLPLLDYLVPTYYILTTAEASSNLSRYDGIKYGHQAKEDQLIKMVNKSRTDGFGDEVKRRILLGTFVLSSGYYDAYYTKAQKIRQLIKRETEKILKKHHYILSPTTPNLPFKLGTKRHSPTELYQEDIFTVQANLSGHPAISFPFAKTKDDFYVSAQLIGRYFSELDMISISKQILENYR